MSAAAADKDLGELLAWRALDQLVARYCRAVDRRDEVLLASLWHPDARIQVGDFVGDPAAFMAFAQVIWAGSRRTFHAVCNRDFEIRGDTAVGEIYVIGVATTPGEAGDQDGLSGGRYLDRYERRHGVWKFSARTFVFDFTLGWPADPDARAAAIAAYGAAGGFAPNDPSLALFASLDRP